MTLATPNGSIRNKVWQTAMLTTETPFYKVGTIPKRYLFILSDLLFKSPDHLKAVFCEF